MNEFQAVDKKAISAVGFEGTRFEEREIMHRLLAFQADLSGVAISHALAEALLEVNPQVDRPGYFDQSRYYSAVQIGQYAAVGLCVNLGGRDPILAGALAFTACRSTVPYDLAQDAAAALQKLFPEMAVPFVYLASLSDTGALDFGDLRALELVCEPLAVQRLCEHYFSEASNPAEREAVRNALRWSAPEIYEALTDAAEIPPNTNLEEFLSSHHAPTVEEALKDLVSMGRTLLFASSAEEFQAAYGWLKQQSPILALSLLAAASNDAHPAQATLARALLTDEIPELAEIIERFHARRAVKTGS